MMPSLVKVHPCRDDEKAAKIQTNFCRFSLMYQDYPLEVLSIASIALGLTVCITALHIIGMGPLHWITVPVPPNWLHRVTREARKAGTLSLAPSQRF